MFKVIYFILKEVREARVLKDFRSCLFENFFGSGSK